MTKLDLALELYQLIHVATQDLPAQKQAMQLRKKAFDSIICEGSLVKVAFDTRRIDQETEMNPRRGLQNYQRSEAFLSQAMGEKLKNLSKLKKVLGSLKDTYGKEPEWQDSNARILLSTLEKGLRTHLNDGDFAESQPGVGSLDYIEELLHVRYRLGFDELSKIAVSDLKRIILSKDEELTRKDVNQALEITKNDVASKGYDTLLEKLFDGCRASEENPDIERTITITIRDRFHKEG